MRIKNSRYRPLRTICSVDIVTEATPSAQRALRELRLRHRSFFDEDRANLLRRIDSAVPFLMVTEIFSAFEPSKLRRLPRRSANGVYHFINSETAFARVPQRVIGKADRFHLYHQRQREEEPQGFRRSQTAATTVADRDPL